MSVDREALREAIARDLFESVHDPNCHLCDGWDDSVIEREDYYCQVDSLLAGPLAPLLAAAEAVERLQRRVLELKVEIVTLGGPDDLDRMGERDT